MTAAKLGFIGLGRMGGGMALNLIRQTGDLHVCDPSPAATEPLQEAGAQIHETPASLAKVCDTVFLCLPAASEVREVLFGAEGLLGDPGRTLTVIDTTTLNRADALSIAADAATAGASYWDCPVSGMPFRATDGTLTVMFGGDKDAFEAARPWLDSFGQYVIHCGGLGAGQAMKAINNIIYNVNIAALCEVLPLTVAVGLDPKAVADVVTSASSRSFASEYFTPRMLQGRFDTDFSMRAAYKDIVNVQQMGIETTASLPVVNAMIASYQAAMAAGFGDEPKSAMLKVYENALGVRFRDPPPD